MQTPSAVLNIGADVAKKAIVVACSEGSFPVREVANRRTALLAFLKSLPVGSRIGVESTGTYTATLVILARRIARTAWSIYTHKTEFDPGRLTNLLT